MEDSSTYHPIACECCRNKKSRCDRELPTCSQCTSSGTACRYPPINKRGIPSGYISIIEQRLLETELVVLELLSTIYNSNIPIDSRRISKQSCVSLANFSQKQSKSAKLEEWKNLPLSTDEQRHSWWAKKQELMAAEAREDAEGPSHHSPTQTNAWPETSPMSAQYEERRSNVVYPPPLDTAQQQLQTPVAIWQSPLVTPPMPGIPTIPEVNESSTTHPPATIAVSAEDARDPYLSTAERWRKYF
ncbi:hypothetical protein BKA66DRAFT_293442 [Pyrenochaeta sp. MPI-SDFR-AT-0127]|nr:hypothetical protein BKA66DRAFT_293442 [Pyrenochaeta sp. MPI-SDFR-AT-0127]